MPNNQTLQEWLDLPSVANDPNALGTGIFINTAGRGKDYLSDITYDDILSRDLQQSFHAFSWVPHAVATFNQLLQQQCGGRCSVRCVTPGCLCDPTTGRCS